MAKPVPISYPSSRVNLSSLLRVEPGAGRNRRENIWSSARWASVRVRNVSWNGAEGREGGGGGKAQPLVRRLVRWGPSARFLSVPESTRVIGRLRTYDIAPCKCTVRQNKTSSSDTLTLTLSRRFFLNLEPNLVSQHPNISFVNNHCFRRYYTFFLFPSLYSQIISTDRNVTRFLPSQEREETKGKERRRRRRKKLDIENVMESP